MSELYSDLILWLVVKLDWHVTIILAVVILLLGLFCNGTANKCPQGIVWGTKIVNFCIESDVFTIILISVWFVFTG